MSIGFSTAEAIQRDPFVRAGAIAAWRSPPDFVSVNIGARARVGRPRARGAARRHSRSSRPASPRPATARRSWRRARSPIARCADAGRGRYGGADRRAGARRNRARRRRAAVAWLRPAQPGKVLAAGAAAWPRRSRWAWRTMLELADGLGSALDQLRARRGRCRADRRAGPVTAGRGRVFECCKALPDGPSTSKVSLGGGLVSSPRRAPYSLAASEEGSGAMGTQEHQAVIAGGGIRRGPTPSGPTAMCWVCQEIDRTRSSRSSAARALYLGELSSGARRRDPGVPPGFCIGDDERIPADHGKQAPSRSTILLDRRCHRLNAGDRSARSASSARGDPPDPRRGRHPRRRGSGDHARARPPRRAGRIRRPIECDGRGPADSLIRRSARHVPERRGASRDPAARQPRLGLAVHRASRDLSPAKRLRSPQGLTWRSSCSRWSSRTRPAFSSRQTPSRRTGRSPRSTPVSVSARPWSPVW